MAPRWPQDDQNTPKMKPPGTSIMIPVAWEPQSGSRMATRWLKDGPAYPQNGAPGHEYLHTRRLGTPKWLQDGPKIAPRWPSICPKKVTELVSDDIAPSLKTPACGGDRQPYLASDFQAANIVQFVPPLLPLSKPRSLKQLPFWTLKPAALY